MFLKVNRVHYNNCAVVGKSCVTLQKAHPVVRGDDLLEVSVVGPIPPWGPITAILEMKL